MPKMNETPTEIVKNLRADANYVGCLACLIDDESSTVQHNADGREFEVTWSGASRCTIWVAKGSEDCIAQIDVGRGGVVRVEAHEPVSIAVDPRRKLLTMVRFRQDLPTIAELRSGVRGLR